MCASCVARAEAFASRAQVHKLRDALEKLLNAQAQLGARTQALRALKNRCVLVCAACHACAEPHHTRHRLRSYQCGPAETDFEARHTKNARLGAAR